MFNQTMNFTYKVQQYLIKQQIKNSRLKAYDICHEKFVNAIVTKHFDYNELALHLYAYLASYGMVCRKSVLLQHNYNVLVATVKIVCEQQYAFLLDIDVFSTSFNKNNYITTLLHLKERLCTSLSISKNSSDTLVSKIILGTLGCMPAYDRYVCQSLKKLHLCKSFSKKGLEDLLSLATYLKKEIIALQSFYKSKNISYSVMKYIDCFLWIR